MKASSQSLLQSLGIKFLRGSGGCVTHSSRHTLILDCIATQFENSLAVREISFHLTCWNSSTCLLMLSHIVLMRQWWVILCIWLTTINESDSIITWVHPFSLASFTPSLTASASSSSTPCPVTLRLAPPMSKPSKFLVTTLSRPLFVRWHHAALQLIFICPGSGFYHPILACVLAVSTDVFGSRMYSSTSFLASSAAALGFGIICSNTTLHLFFHTIQHIHIHSCHLSSLTAWFIVGSFLRFMIQSPIERLSWWPSVSPIDPSHTAYVHLHL